MPLEYHLAPDVKELFEEIVERLGFTHILPERVFCFRSKGSRARLVTARVHSLPKLWQFAIDEAPHYAIEVISEQFDRLATEEKVRVLIHEALHIPKSFAGGFRPHKGWITKKRVEALYLSLTEGRRTAKM